MKSLAPVGIPEPRPGSFSFPRSLITTLKCQSPSNGSLSVSPGTGPQIAFPDRLPSLSQARSPSPQRSRGNEATCILSIPPALVCGCLFCHMLFCDRIRAINMTRPVESALGGGSESQGCGPASNDPGARARPEPGSTAPDTRALPTPRPGTGARGCPVAERDKHILAVRNHFLLTVPNSGGAGPSLCVLSKKGKLPVCEGKKPSTQLDGAWTSKCSYKTAS